jgi:hypothetical protein
MTMLSHDMNDKGVHVTDEDEGQMDQKIFMQKHKNVTRGTNVARRATVQTSIPVGTARMTMSCQLDQVLSNRSKNSRPNRIGWSG